MLTGFAKSSHPSSSKPAASYIVYSGVFYHALTLLSLKLSVHNKKKMLLQLLSLSLPASSTEKLQIPLRRKIR